MCTSVAHGRGQLTPNLKRTELKRDCNTCKAVNCGTRLCCVGCDARLKYRVLPSSKIASAFCAILGAEMTGCLLFPQSKRV